MKNRKSLNLIIFFHILILISVSILAIIQISFYENSSPYIFSIITMISIFWCFISWIYITKDKLSPYLIFLLACSLFWSGQTILYALNIRAGNFELYFMYSNKELILAETYTCLAFLFLHLGSLICFIFKNKRKIICIDAIQDKVLIFSIKKVVTPICIISGIGYLSDLFNKVSMALTNGYRALYEQASSGNGILNILNSIDLFFIPCIYILIVICKDNKKVRYVITSLILMIFIGNIIIGLRGNAFGIIISFTWLYSNQIKKFSFKNMCILTLSGILGLILISVVAEFRHLTNKTIDSFFRVFIEVVYNDNPIFDSIAEFGGSMFPMIETINIMNYTNGYGYGISYLSSVLAIIPSVLFGGYSFASHAALATWLKETLGMSYGPGYSLVAESYYNFSWLGLIAMSIIGYIVIDMLYPICKNRDNQILKNTFVAVMIFYLVIYSRSSVLLLIRYLFYSIIVINFMISIVYKKNKSMKNL